VNKLDDDDDDDDEAVLTGRRSCCCCREATECTGVEAGHGPIGASTRRVDYSQCVRSTLDNRIVRLAAGRRVGCGLIDRQKMLLLRLLLLLQTARAGTAGDFAHS